MLLSAARVGSHDTCLGMGKDGQSGKAKKTDGSSSWLRPGRTCDRENGDYPRFVFRARPDDGLLILYLLPLIRSAAAAPVLRLLLYVLGLPAQLELEHYLAGMETESARMTSAALAGSS